MEELAKMAKKRRVVSKNTGKTLSGFKRVVSPWGELLVSIGPTDLDVVCLPACIEVEPARHMSIDDYYRIFWPRTHFMMHLD